MMDNTQWIAAFFQEESAVSLLADKPVFAQVDSFAVVGFLIACDERFTDFSAVDTDQLAQLTLAELAAVLNSLQG
jgi:hypothetical protein